MNVSTPRAKITTLRTWISRFLILVLLANAGAAAAASLFTADSDGSAVHSMAGTHHDHGDADVSSSDDPSCFNCVAHCSGMTVETVLDARLEPLVFSSSLFTLAAGIVGPPSDEPPRLI